MSGTSDDDTNRGRYPVGLAAPQIMILLVLVGIIGPGLAVYSLEQASLPILADLVWIVGYGTGIFLVWFIWFRPVDLVGPTGQTLTSESESGESDHDTLDDDQQAKSGNSHQATNDSTADTSGAAPDHSSEES
ncbi:hypothetical protein [Haloarcula laminariae]|uniref:hypothetical protein n=1 Tax=Haloarcula laminariae TaxID=2961577 RepID=UPI0021C780A5|nr:hypothetical protein [Halomicroarcula laminariae]